MMYTGYMGAVYFDWTFYALLAAMLLSFYAQIKTKLTFNKYAKKTVHSGFTAQDAAKKVLDDNSVAGVSFGKISGNLTDNFNPKTNHISLSDSVYDKRSVAAVGVACHEAGHAVQHDAAYVPAKLRMAMVPVTNFGARLSMPLLLIGFFLGLMGLVWLGIALFSLSTLFQLVTLPTEFDASRRALRALTETGVLEKDEIKGAKRVLSAAAMTYVAALASSAIMLLRYVAMSKRRR